MAFAPPRGGDARAYRRKTENLHARGDAGSNTCWRIFDDGTHGRLDSQSASGVQKHIGRRFGPFDFRHGENPVVEVRKQACHAKHQLDLLAVPLDATQ